MILDAYFTGLLREPPQSIVLGTKVYVPTMDSKGNFDIIEMLTINGQNVEEFGEMVIKGQGGDLKATQQFALTEFLGGNLYFGTIAPDGNEGMGQRYLVYGVDTPASVSETIMNSLKLGYIETTENRQSPVVDGNGSAVLNPDGTLKLEDQTETQHSLLIIDSIGYKDGKIFLGVTGLLKVDTDNTGNNVKGLHGVMKYDMTDRFRLIIEAGVAVSEGEGSTQVDLFDPLLVNHLLSIIHKDKPLTLVPDMDIISRDCLRN